MINESQKQNIAGKLAEYVEKYESQARAARSLKNVSAATINHILNGKWELIKDEMWRNIASQIGYREEKWNAVEIRDYKMLKSLLNDAQENSIVFAVTGEAGTGKSYALRHYAENNKNAFLLQCNEFWNRKTFLQELLTVLGRDYGGYTVVEMMNEIVRILKVIDQPLLIFDEFDKVSDQILYFFITLYNQLEDHCGIVLCATDHLAKRVKRGLKLNKKGYKEIYSRIGRRFIELKGVSSSDITAICMANGINAREEIKLVIEESEGDLRRVRRKIHAIKRAA
jgi:DNA transposition AAA+ family ATPase